MTILIALFSALAIAGNVTPQNWKTHPEITEIRVLRKSIQDGATHPDWTAKKEDSPQCAGQSLTKRSILMDPKGTIRRYTSQGHTDGVSYWTTQYYNDQGRLQFTHLRLTHDEQQATTEYTAFLDVHGDRLFEHVQRTTDDQAIHPAGLPEKYLMMRPKKAWAAPSPCGSQ